MPGRKCSRNADIGPNFSSLLLHEKKLIILFCCYSTQLIIVKSINWLTTLIPQLRKSKKFANWLSINSIYCTIPWRWDLVSQKSWIGIIKLYWNFEEFYTLIYIYIYIKETPVNYSRCLISQSRISCSNNHQGYGGIIIINYKFHNIAHFYMAKIVDL